MLVFDDGREESYELSEQIENLSEFKVGDTILAGYARSLGSELRAPTPAELENSWEIVEEFNGPNSETRTGTADRLIHAVMTVEVLDRINMTATLRGPRENHCTIKVKDPAHLKKMKISQTVMANSTEALVLSWPEGQLMREAAVGARFPWGRACRLPQLPQPSPLRTTRRPSLPGGLFLQR